MSEQTISVEAPKNLNYQDFVTLLKSNNVTYIPTEAEYNELISNKNLRFIGPLPISTLGAAGSMFFRNHAKLSAAAANGPESLFNTTINILKEEGLADKASDFIFNKINSNFGGKGRSAVPGSKSDGSGGSLTMMGRFDTDPIRMELSPGLVNRTYADNYNFPDDARVYTHITGARIAIPGDSAMNYFYTNVLMPQLQHRAQMAVNFNVDLSILSVEKFTEYLDNITNALNIYYFCSSIISYCNVPTNPDRGMYALRAMMTANDLDYLNQLRQLLLSLPIPPNLNKTLFYLNQTFTDGPSTQTILKLMPLSFNSTNDDQRGEVTGFLGTDSYVISHAIEDLNTQDSLKIASLLSRITPEWILPNIYDASPVPIYSEGFLTVFSNVPHTYGYGTQFYGPVVANEDVNLNTATFENQPDGLSIGLLGCYINSVSDERPGLLKHVSSAMIEQTQTLFFNRYSYCYSDTLKRGLWMPSNLKIEAAFGRIDRIKAYQGSNYYARVPNSYSPVNVSVKTIRNSARDVLAWMLSMDTIKKKENTSKSNWRKGKTGGGN